MNRSRCLLLAGAFTLTLGCGGPRLADTVDWELDFELTISDDLHSPYAKGSLFTVYAVGVPEDEEHRYEVKSGDTGVLFCASNGTAEAACEGTGEGEVDLLLSREGQPVHTAPVEVLQADGAWAFPRAEMMAAHGRPVLPRARVKVLLGGTATFQVVLTGEGRVLSGSGSVTASGPADVGVDVRQTLLFEDRDWLQITPSELGTQEVQVFSAGVPVGKVRMEVVDDSAVDSVVLAGESEEGAGDGELLTIVGVARDEDGAPIYGVDFDWDLDGVEEPGEGDLFRYVFDEDRPRTVTAHFGDRSGSLDVHAESGYVDSTNRLGCALASPAPAGGLAWMAGALGLVGLGLSRRRRPRRCPSRGQRRAPGPVMP